MSDEMREAIEAAYWYINASEQELTDSGKPREWYLGRFHRLVPSLESIAALTHRQSKSEGELAALIMKECHFTHNMALSAVRALTNAGHAKGWLPIESCPRDGELRLYAAKFSSGEFSHWEYYALWIDDSGSLRDMSGDYFHACEFDDFSHWMPLPTPPVEADKIAEVEPQTPPVITPQEIRTLLEGERRVKDVGNPNGKEQRK